MARLAVSGSLHLAAALAAVHAKTASGPGGARYACAPCRERRRILTVAEHPPDSLGEVRYLPRPDECPRGPAPGPP